MAATQNLICRSSEAPIDRIPPEVLSQVFLHGERPKVPRTKAYPPLSVSRHWRYVAQGCVELWSQINLCERDFPRGEQYDPLKSLRTTLALGSGNFPLDIYIEPWEVGSLPFSARFTCAVQCICVEVTRWRSIQIKVPAKSKETLDNVIRVLPLASRLKNLDVELYQWSRHEKAVLFQDAGFNRATVHLPSLSALSIQIAQQSVLPMIESGRLSMLKIGYTMARNLHVSLNKAAETLTDLEITHLSSLEAPPSSIPYPPIAFPLLRRLVVVGEKSLARDTHGLVAHLLAHSPALEDLALMIFGASAELDNVCTTVSQNCHDIKRLTLTFSQEGSPGSFETHFTRPKGPNWSHQQAEAMLSSFPHLEELHLCWMCRFKETRPRLDSYLTALAECSGNGHGAHTPAMCPELKSLRLRKLVFTADQLMDVCKMRSAYLLAASTSDPFRITVKRCPRLPNLEAVTYEAFAEVLSDLSSHRLYGTKRFSEWDEPTGDEFYTDASMDGESEAEVEVEDTEEEAGEEGSANESGNGEGEDSEEEGSTGSDNADDEYDGMPHLTPDL